MICFYYKSGENRRITNIPTVFLVLQSRATESLSLTKGQGGVNYYKKTPRLVGLACHHIFGDLYLLINKLWIAQDCASKNQISICNKEKVNVRIAVKIINDKQKRTALVSDNLWLYLTRRFFVFKFMAIVRVPL